MVDDDTLPLLGAQQLHQLPAPRMWPSECTCAALKCAGWESIGAPVKEPLLRRLGTLRKPGDDEPTLAEWPGPGYWSADAAVAPSHYPYNRCEVWACTGCGRGFVQYTEYGGYYVDHRIRQIDPALVV